MGNKTHAFRRWLFKPMKCYHASNRPHELGSDGTGVQSRPCMIRSPGSTDRALLSHILSSVSRLSLVAWRHLRSTLWLSSGATGDQFSSPQTRKSQRRKQKHHFTHCYASRIFVPALLINFVLNTMTRIPLLEPIFTIYIRTHKFDHRSPSVMIRIQD